MKKKTLTQQYFEHERALIDYLRKKTIFDRAFPLHCRTCRGSAWTGSGTFEWSDNLCPDCSEKSICALCSGELDENNDYETCLDCGYDTTEGGINYSDRPDGNPLYADEFMWLEPNLYKKALLIMGGTLVFAQRRASETWIRKGEDRYLEDRTEYDIEIVWQSEAGQRGLEVLSFDEVRDRSASRRSHLTLNNEAERKIWRVLRMIEFDIPFLQLSRVWDDVLREIERDDRVLFINDDVQEKTVLYFNNLRAEIREFDLEAQ